jgi:nifR3 family TIM-barrel protein
MAGVTDLAFRCLAVEQGCGLVVSEMVSAKGLLMGGEKTRFLLASTPEERPLSVQLFGDEPEVIGEAALIVEQSGAAMVDINMGCPAKKVVGGGAGSALLKDLPRIGCIIDAVKKKVSIPLTIKIRTGWDTSSIVACDVLKIAEDKGADAIAVHGRTKTQAFGGEADWSIIAEVKSRASIPVIGNGDVSSAKDVLKMMDTTGCDGVMIGRGAMGNPWIFAQAQGLLSKGDYELPSVEEKGTLVLKHFEMIIELYGEYRGVRLFRKHLAWYVKGMEGASKFRSIINYSVNPDEVRELVSGFFSETPSSYTGSFDHTEAELHQDASLTV